MLKYISLLLFAGCAVIPAQRYTSSTTPCVNGKRVWTSHIRHLLTGEQKRLARVEINGCGAKKNNVLMQSTIREETLPP